MKKHGTLKATCSRFFDFYIGGIKLAVQLVKGTKDLYGSEVLQWQTLEQKIRQLCAVFGIGEMRTPMFEFTELFARGVGETTDIVDRKSVV